MRSPKRLIVVGTRPTSLSTIAQQGDGKGRHSQQGDRPGGQNFQQGELTECPQGASPADGQRAMYFPLVRGWVFRASSLPTPTAEQKL